VLLLWLLLAALSATFFSFCERVYGLTLIIWAVFFSSSGALYSEGSTTRYLGRTLRPEISCSPYRAFRCILFDELFHLWYQGAIYFGSPPVCRMNGSLQVFSSSRAPALQCSRLIVGVFRLKCLSMATRVDTCQLACFLCTWPPSFPPSAARPCLPAFRPGPKRIRSAEAGAPPATTCSVCVQTN